MLSGRQPTIHDVAAASGRSRGTVSRYLNGGKNVSPAAAGAIEKAIETTGYRVNVHARSLRSNRADTVAFLLPQSLDLLFTDPVHGILARECAAALSASGQSMVMLMAGSDAERDRASSYILSGHVDGVLVVGSDADHPIPAQLAEAGVPMVACARRPERAVSYSTVSSDSHAAFAETVRMLHAQGRQRIAFLGGTSSLDESALRFQGYAAGLDEEIAATLVAMPDHASSVSAADSTRALIERTRFDALVCVNDMAAAAGLAELARAGLRVPDDVAVVGFDNVVSICDSTCPTLTSVAQDFPAIAHAMVEQLNALSDNGVPRHVDVPVRLVRRESA